MVIHDWISTDHATPREEFPVIILIIDKHGDRRVHQGSYYNGSYYDEFDNILNNDEVKAFTFFPSSDNYKNPPDRNQEGE